MRVHAHTAPAVPRKAARGHETVTAPTSWRLAFLAARPGFQLTVGRQHPPLSPRRTAAAAAFAGGRRAPVVGERRFGNHKAHACGYASGLWSRLVRPGKKIRSRRAFRANPAGGSGVERRGCTLALQTALKAFETRRPTSAGDCVCLVARSFYRPRRLRIKVHLGGKLLNPKSSSNAYLR